MRTRGAAHAAPDTRRGKVRALLLALSVTVGACAGPGRAPAHVDDAESVAAFFAHYIATLEERDPAAVRELFVDDGRFAWFTDGARSYGSPDDVLRGMQRYAEFEFRTQLDDVTVLALGARHATASASFSTELSSDDAPPFRYGGVITLVVERAPDAGWRILRGHTSTPGGPPTDAGAPSGAA